MMLDSSLLFYPEFVSFQSFHLTVTLTHVYVCVYTVYIYVQGSFSRYAYRQTYQKSNVTHLSVCCMYRPGG
jgi:hypothetical protein